ncbi:MAG TPA: hypothetical protein VII69_04915 [Candidatus Eremiobacteraceae bacterium]
MSTRSADGVRAAWIAIALIVVSLPHVLEDFTFGEPARVGVSTVAAVSVLLAAYALQLFGALLAFRDDPWGGRLVAALGLVWFVGALAIHGPEILAQGLSWRFGTTSVGEAALVVAAAVLAMWYGSTAAQSGSRNK